MVTKNERNDMSDSLEMRERKELVVKIDYRLSKRIENKRKIEETLAWSGTLHVLERKTSLSTKLSEHFVFQKLPKIRRKKCRHKARAK